MRPTYGCPENFRDSLTTPTALFPTFSCAFVPINPMNVPTKFEVRRSVRPVPEIIGVAKLQTRSFGEGEAVGGPGWYRSKERW